MNQPALSVKIDAETKNRIQQLAVVKRRSTHWLMKEAIRQYVDREEKREAFLRDGVNAWEEYQATGLHVGQVEADAWMARLENGEDAELPQCHE